MNRKLVINSNVSETRIALVEDGAVAELYIERQTKRGMVGNIYKARVSRVLPGMQSAFVSIGASRSAFLFGGDVIDPVFLEQRRLASPIEDPEDDPRRSTYRTPIEQLLRDNQEIVVQVVKEPLGTKGPRVTMLVTVPGRYLVLMPDFDHIGISRRIVNEESRERLKSLIAQIKPEGMGVIVRTAADGIGRNLLEKDLEYLLKVWRSVCEEKNKNAAPSILYQEPDIVVKAVRDLYSDDVTEIVTDSPLAFNQLKHFLLSSIPGSDEKLKLYQKNNPIFDEYGIEMDIAKGLSSKVWLPSGGYLVIDQTEALTSFDVNTGKFVGSASAQETILKTNLEAIRTIVAQIRLRNLGGIIVIDFIDMEQAQDREQINQALLDALKADKARTNVLAINDLGLVQMTRKRTSESLERTLTSICPHCDGRGRVLSVETEAYNVIRDIERHVLRTGQNTVTVKAREDIMHFLQNEEHQLLQLTLERYGLELRFVQADLKMQALQEAPYEVY